MSSVRADVLVAAKREVLNLARQGKILSPKDAWLLSGHMKDGQTLWSISFRIAQRNNCSAEELCSYLEDHFPQYTSQRLDHVTWDDVRHG